jgi:hypothetical protein
MVKTAVIHQPDFMPYIGFFHRLLQADIFILLDHVQFVSHSTRSWTHRDKIKTANGECWLTINVKKAPLGTPINQIELAENDWRAKNLNLVRENYQGAAYFAELFSRVQALYAIPYKRLVDFNIASIKMLMEWFGIEIPMINSSDMQPNGRKNELLVDLLKKAGANRYLSGLGARNYYQPEPFLDAGIEVLWQQFTHPVYPQQFGEFIPYLSSIDLFFNCGIEQSQLILRSI